MSKHHGDGTPGTKVYVECDGVRDYHQYLISKKYKYNQPGLEEESWDSNSFTVIVPFMNQIAFNEKINDSN